MQIFTLTTEQVEELLRGVDADLAAQTGEPTTEPLAYDGSFLMVDGVLWVSATTTNTSMPFSAWFAKHEDEYLMAEDLEEIQEKMFNL